MHIPHKKIERWSKEEVDLLKRLYPEAWVGEIAGYFPKRNKATIVAKAMALGLQSAKSWSNADNAVLKRSFRLESKTKLLRLLSHRTWLAILAQGERLGLKRETHRPRRVINATYFKNWTGNMAYILGFILADGCIIKGSYAGYSDSLKFGVQISDIDILEKIKRELKSGHTISEVRNAAYLSISSQEMVDDLKILGVIYNKSLNEQWPAVPSLFIKDFIRGIIDGDGSIHFDKRGYPTISLCGGKTTLENTRNYLIKTLGVYSKLDRKSYSKRCRSYLYQIAYRCNPAKKITGYLYNNATLYLDRKFKLAQKCLATKIKVRDNSNRVGTAIRNLN